VAANASALGVVADSLRYMGELEGALKTISQAQASIVGITFRDELARANITHNLLWRRGVILGADGQISLMRPEEAITALQQAFDIAEDMAQRDLHEMSFRILFNQDARELGNILRHQNPERALAVFDHGILRLSEIKQNAKARRGEAQLLAASAYPLLSLKRPVEARQRIDRAIEILRQTKDYPAAVINTDDETKTVLSALGDYLSETGNTRQAESVYQELLTKLMASHPDPDNDVRHATALSHVYAALTQLHLHNGEVEEAKNTSALRLKIWQHWYRKLPNNAFVQRELASASGA
jgi:tetratricopeptide (TPR) repeat protein